MTVSVDHNYPHANAMLARYNNGEPIPNATVKVYAHTDFYDDGVTVPVAETTTDSAGEWQDTILLEDGRTWVVAIQKNTSFGPCRWEVTT